MKTQTRLSPKEKRIRMAMENTWEKNINPEAVPDLLEALKITLNEIENYTGIISREHIRNTVKKAISKATI